MVLKTFTINVIFEDVFIHDNYARFIFKIYIYLSLMVICIILFVNNILRFYEKILSYL